MEGVTCFPGGEKITKKKNTRIFFRRRKGKPPDENGGCPFQSRTRKRIGLPHIYYITKRAICQELFSSLLCRYKIKLTAQTSHNARERPYFHFCAFQGINACLPFHEPLRPFSRLVSGYALSVSSPGTYSRISPGWHSRRKQRVLMLSRETMTP